MTQHDLDQLAKLLVKRCSPETVAALLNDFLCIEADPEYTDKEVDLGMAFFDALTNHATNKIMAIATGSEESDFDENTSKPVAKEYEEIYGN